MTTNDRSLLLEWDLLQKEVVPSLIHDVHGGPPRSWSLRSVEDAASIAVAFDAATGAGSMESYATAAQSEVGFRRLDLGQVPYSSREEYFVREDRRWFVDERIAARVFLHEPPAAVDRVDVVTISESASDRAVDVAVDLIRPGGRLVAVGPEREHRGSERLAHAASGRTCSVYEKRSSRSAGSPRQCRTDRGKDAQPTETLAHARAQRKLVEDHAKLAASLARRFAHRGEPDDDLEQVAMLALVKAAKRFDPQRDTRFASYATTSIVGELKRYFRDKSWAMKVPRPLQETYLEIKKVREELSHQLGTAPTVEQIAQRLGVAAGDVATAMGAGENFWARSLDTPSDPDQRPLEIPVEDDGYERALDRVHTQRRMPLLDEQEQLVLRRIHFDDWTQRQVAAELGVSQMHVCRLQARALSKLRT